jgi:hypothetical protein
VRVLGEMNWTDYKLSVANIYRRFADRAGSEDTSYVRRQNNYMRAGLASSRVRNFELDVGYTFGIEDYLSDDIIFVTDGQTMSYLHNDRYIHVADAKVGYMIQPKTELLIQTFLGTLDYPSSLMADSWFTETVVGIEGKPTSKLKTDFRVGVRWQDYGESNIKAEKDFIGLGTRGLITYEITDDDRVELRTERNIYESVFQQMPYYLVDHYGLDYTHYFNDKMSGSAFGYYQRNSYPTWTAVGGHTKKRYDDFIGIGALLRYDIKKWASAMVSYEYKHRESNFEFNDYKASLVKIGGTIGY